MGGSCVPTWACRYLPTKGILFGRRSGGKIRRRLTRWCGWAARRRRGGTGCPPGPGKPQYLKNITVLYLYMPPILRGYAGFQSPILRKSTRSRSPILRYTVADSAWIKSYASAITDSAWITALVPRSPPEGQGQAMDRGVVQRLWARRARPDKPRERRVIGLGPSPPDVRRDQSPPLTGSPTGAIAGSLAA